jgi:hypothetical protein
MGAAADCETIGAGFLGQPVNAISALGFVIAGLIIVLNRPSLRWVGTATIATGIGSFLFHGPMPPWAEWAHDVTLAWLLSVVAGQGTRWARLSRLPALAGLGALFAVAPAVADPVAVALSVVAVVSLLRRDRSAATLAPLLLLGAVAVIGRLGATGNPLCDPSSLLQPHAVWHLGAAAAVVWWVFAASPATWRTAGVRPGTD